jgi:hypothetical protein
MGNCSIERCNREVRSKGLCGLHYDRKIRGRELIHSDIYQDEWFDVPSHSNYAVSPNGKVLSKRHDRILTTYTHPSGHVSVRLGRGPAGLVHRLVCEAFHGPAPEGKPWALHRNGDAGDNRPENLYWGDREDNAQDMIRHGRHRNARKTHCKRNHEFTPENTIWRSQGTKRECRTCENEAQRARYRKGKK